MKGNRDQELCESRRGRPGFPVLKSRYGLCGRKATLNLNSKERSFDSFVFSTDSAKFLAAGESKNPGVLEETIHDSVGFSTDSTRIP